MAYLPVHLVDFDGINVGKYTIHGSPKRSQLVKISTPTPVGSFEDVDPLVAVMLETGLLVPKW